MTRNNHLDDRIEIHAGGVPAKEPADFILSRDGKELFRGTEAQCMARLHRLSPSSIDHATKWEGYKITAVTPRYVVKCDDCKRELRETDSLHESACGGLCDDCRAESAKAAARVAAATT